MCFNKFHLLLSNNAKWRHKEFVYSEKKYIWAYKGFLLERIIFSINTKGKLIQTTLRVDHSSLRNKPAETCNFMASPTKCSLSLPATSQIIYLATLLLAFSLCLSHIWCSKYDAFNKHVYKLVIYFWHYFSFFFTPNFIHGEETR